MLFTLFLSCNRTNNNNNELANKIQQLEQDNQELNEKIEELESDKKFLKYPNLDFIILKINISEV